jgi:Domain of unknown function (DUF4331)
MNMNKKILCLLAIALSGALPALASSHREAPFVSRTPKVDGTDYYVFNSYQRGREKYVTMIADYLPLQDGYGGPNFFNLDPDAIYEIHLDNNADAKEDLTFQFKFKTTLKDIQLPIGKGENQKMVSVPFTNVGAISAGNLGALNVQESYTVNVIRGDRRSGKLEAVSNLQTGAKEFLKPADNIGKKSIPDYAEYARAYLYDIKIPGCEVPGRLFVGQRKDPFVVNLGETFDLVNIKNPLGSVTGGKDDLADKNVTAIELEVAKSCLTAGDSGIVGSWTTASLPKIRNLTTDPTYAKPASSSGEYVQVSRLSNPLVNEVVIGIKDKDKFNASEPKDDGQFATYVTHPTLPAVLELLFGAAGVKAPTLFPRADLVAAFLTGVDGLNKNGSVAEMLRLNTKIDAKSLDEQNNLGVIGGDTAGFPNGRRPGDDVVDIALRVVMGKLLPADVAPSGQLPFTDGANVTDSMFDASFPYLKTPIPGSM